MFRTLLSPIENAVEERRPTFRRDLQQLLHEKEQQFKGRFNLAMIKRVMGDRVHSTLIRYQYEFKFRWPDTNPFEAHAFWQVNLRTGEVAISGCYTAPTPISLASLTEDQANTFIDCFQQAVVTAVNNL